MTTKARVHALDLDILRQPDDVTCGPTCLHAVYGYFGDEVSLGDLIADVKSLEEGGTLAVNLANHALRRGYRALIYTYDLRAFDPTWFDPHAPDLGERLRTQLQVKRGRELRDATQSYLEFLRLGGRLAMEDLSADLLRRWLERDIPILAGLSATFLYQCAREHGLRWLEYDDVRGVPTGHFVVLCGWNEATREVRVADPFDQNPRFQEHFYWIPVARVINAILLGDVTYDANLLVLEPAKLAEAPEPPAAPPAPPNR